MQHRGFGLISLLAALAVIGIVCWLTILAFSNYRAHHSVQAGAEQVLSTLAAAREKTLAGINNSQYGVHFQSDRLILFRGASYPGTTVQTIDLDSTITIPTITLAGGGTNVIFNRLTGATAQTGTIVVRLASDATQSIIITIAATGAAYAQ
jgi:Tfp pilus assembly protein PilE